MKFITTVPQSCENNSWLSFYPKWDYNGFTVSESFYFDSRPHVYSNVTFILGLILSPLLGIYSLFLLPLLFWGWGQFYLALPFDTGIDRSDYKEFGFSWGSNDSRYAIEHLYFKFGSKFKFIDLPLLSRQFYEHSVMLKDGTWETEYYNTKPKKEFWNDEIWKDKVWSETHVYTNTTSWGEIQEANATIKVERREWRRKWMMWTSLGSYKRKVIDISFDQEIGDRAGSYKGGTVGCSYDLKPNETPLECLRRMEKERSFVR